MYIMSFPPWTVFTQLDKKPKRWTFIFSWSSLLRLTRALMPPESWTMRCPTALFAVSRNKCSITILLPGKWKMNSRLTCDFIPPVDDRGSRVPCHFHNLMLISFFYWTSAGVKIIMLIGVFWKKKKKYTDLLLAFVAFTDLSVPFFVTFSLVANEGLSAGAGFRDSSVKCTTYKE